MKKLLSKDVEKGFSLIELLVVAAIITTLLSIGVSALVTYSNVQAFDSKVSELATTLETAKTYAQSQVKKCTSTFAGYSISVDASANTYSLNALCATDTADGIETKTLRAPIQVSGSDVTFNALTGVSSGGPITITGYGRCQSVSVNGAGNISVGNVRFTCP